MYSPLDFIRAIHAIFACRVKTARKIRAAREYMRAAHNLCARIIRACIASALSMFSLDFVVKIFSCGFVSIRGSKDFEDETNQFVRLAA